MVITSGAWRMATGRKIEAHNLYGQLLGELGTVGAVAFLFMLSALFVNYRKLGRLIRAQASMWRTILLSTR